MNKMHFVLMILLLFSFVGFSQDSLSVKQDTIYWIKKHEVDSDVNQVEFINRNIGDKNSIYWAKKNEVGFDINQVAFINWNIGGENSISGLIKGRFERRYEKNMLSWDNDLTLRYGINKQEDREMRKTEDIFQFVSTVGYKMSKTSHWSYSSKFNFNTQFTNGYAYPDTEVAISHAFAPAYIFLGIGADYTEKRNEKNERISFYISPFTVKSTLVLNQRLADQGAFGIREAAYDLDENRTGKGKMHKTEVGILLANNWRKQIYENITFENKIQLFSDYFNNFGNIDLDWEMQFDFIVNRYVKASMSLHIIYDDDVKAREKIAGEMVRVGPKVQLKQALAIGLVYTW